MLRRGLGRLRLEPLTFIAKEKLKCPAEENENCEKLPLTNAKKSCGKTDTRTNRAFFGMFFYKC
jgi:hypothetical protein